MAKTPILNTPSRKDRPPSAPAKKPAKHRNWTYFNEEQQARFLRVQKKKGLDGNSLLSLCFNEYADKEGIE